MAGALVRVVALVFGLAVAGCATAPESAYDSSAELDGAPSTKGARIVTPRVPVECVPYARQRSGVVLYGDAGAWWDKADGRYRKRRTPRLGSVMVLTGYAGPGRGHVGVVSALVAPREIRLDHANWLGDGAIYLADPVADVSPDNDWSEVRVWNARTHAWGLRTYAVEGFIGPEAIAPSDRIAAE
jgi:hypothetical protein